MLRSCSRRRLFGVAALLVLGLASVWRLRQRPLPEWHPKDEAGPRPQWRGVFHVHSGLSHDSRTPVATLAAAARELGLDFVVLTDHNLQAPAAMLVEGVLMLSYAELSTRYGHLIALDASAPTARESRRSDAVVAQLRRRGVAPIVAHPSDRKRPWTPAEPDPQPGAPARHASPGNPAGAGEPPGVSEMTEAGEHADRWPAGVAGVEIVNVAAAARRRGGPLLLGLVPLVLSLPFRPALALSQLYDDDVQAMRRWAEVGSPSFGGFCGLDAHGRLPSALELRSWQMAVPHPIGAQLSPAALVEQLRRGQFYCYAGLFEGTPQLHFFARKGRNVVAQMGDTAHVADIEALVVDGPALARTQQSTTLWRGSQLMAHSTQLPLIFTTPPPGVYRAQIDAAIPNLLWGSHRAPVLYSNRIEVRGVASSSSSSSP